MARKKTRRCPRGVVKSGPRKGQCKKKPGPKKGSTRRRRRR
jgi:hypothetical protein